MRKILFLLLVMAPAAAGANPAPPAPGDRLVPLLANGCTGDGRWCVVLAPPDSDGPPRPAVRPGPVPRPAPPAPADDAPVAWPSLVVLRDGGFLAGVLTRSSTGYSGGGGSATELALFHLPAGEGGPPRPVLTLPMEASLMIRACFSERDMQKRQGVCHDEYGFSAQLQLAPETAAGLPVLRYATYAWAFPRGVSRSADSNTMRPLRRSDLARQRDDACSITRQFRFDPASRAFQPDQPLPDCADYTVP